MHGSVSALLPTVATLVMQVLAAQQGSVLVLSVWALLAVVHQGTCEACHSGFTAAVSVE